MPHVHFHYRESRDETEENPGLRDEEVQKIAAALPSICAKFLSDDISAYREDQIVVLPMPISGFAQNARAVMIDIFRTARDRPSGAAKNSGREIANRLQEQFLFYMPDGSMSVWIVGEEGGFSFR